MNDEHVLAFVETIDRADLDAIHVFALDAIFGDDVGHERSFFGLSGWGGGLTPPL
jgi:hypothetical protein